MSQSEAGLVSLLSRDERVHASGERDGERGRLRTRMSHTQSLGSEFLRALPCLLHVCAHDAAQRGLVLNTKQTITQNLKSKKNILSGFT